MRGFYAVLLVVLMFFSCKDRTRDISHVTDFSDIFKITYNSKIECFIPKDFEVIGIDSGYINRDTLIDYAVALRYINEKTLYNEEKNEPIRPVLVILGHPDTLIQVSRCDSALYAFYMGGMIDPFGSVEIDSMGVIIKNAGGSGNARWEVVSKFHYDSVDNNIYLQEYFSRGYIDDDLQTTISKTHLTQKDFGRVRFDEYSIYKWEEI